MLETAARDALLPRGRQVDFGSLSTPDRWKPEFAVPFNQRVIGSKILISNDDGYLAPGLAALYEALKPLADVTVMAPEQSCSGASSVPVCLD